MTHDEFESIAALDAIDAASAEEESALRTHLMTCQGCGRARDEFKEAATLLARDLDPVAPPAEVRQQIMENIQPGEITLVESHRRFSIRPWWLATAATLFLALWGWRELGIRAARERIATQTAENRQLAEENELLAQRNQKLSAEMEGLASPDTRTISLSGQQVSPSASAKVFLEPSNRRAVVFFYNLPANPANKSYQLWIIRADQPNPQSAGVFDVSSSGKATISVENLPVATEIKALAVTLEPKGGVDQPTNTTFYLMGKS
jgi:cell division protein FtsB